MLTQSPDAGPVLLIGGSHVPKPWRLAIFYRRDRISTVAGCARSLYTGLVWCFASVRAPWRARGDFYLLNYSPIPLNSLRRALCGSFLSRLGPHATCTQTFSLLVAGLNSGGSKNYWSRFPNDSNSARASRRQLPYAGPTSACQGSARRRPQYDRHRQIARRFRSRSPFRFLSAD